ncbi:pentatricopeptide repeat-containing protein [Tanacetum coccineum]
MNENPELNNESYVLYDHVMTPLAAQLERKPRRDHGIRRGRHSTSSSSAFDQPSSSYLNNDDDYGNDEGTSRASTPSPIRYELVDIVKSRVECSGSGVGMKRSGDNDSMSPHIDFVECPDGELLKRKDDVHCVTSHEIYVINSRSSFMRYYNHYNSFQFYAFQHCIMTVSIEESDERTPRLQALIVAGFKNDYQVEPYALRLDASTSSSYWDTEGYDDCGTVNMQDFVNFTLHYIADLDIPIKSQEDALAFDNLFVQDCKFKLWFLNDLILSLALLSIFQPTSPPKNNFIMSYCMLHGLKPKKRIGEWPKRQGCGSS